MKRSPDYKASGLTGAVTALALLSLTLFVYSCSDSGAPVGPVNGGGGGTPGVNQPPALSAIGDQYVAINNPLQFTISASDIESTPTVSVSGAPVSSTIVDNADGTATFSWTPLPADAGLLSITFTATDDSLSAVSETVRVAVITHTFANYIGPLFQARCAFPGLGCHDAFRASAFNVETYASVLLGGFAGKGIVPGDTTASVVYQRLLGNIGERMPLGGVGGFFQSPELDSIAVWILARAPEN
ncbi:MAG: Ig-like domain-containing protein [Candidatus Zixiibacteriota bacterium]